MPIKKDEWDRGRKWNTTEERILTFLRNNKNTGFTNSEILDGIGYKARVDDFRSFIGVAAAFWSINDALNTLIKEGTVKAKIVKKAVGEETYYMSL